MTTLTFLKRLLSRKNLQIIIISSTCGGVLQILCTRYIKNHPELFEEKTYNFKETETEIKNKTRNRRFRRFFRRGGQVVSIQVILAVINFISENGFIVTTLFSGASVIVSNIPTKAISAYLGNALPQKLPQLEKYKCKKFILVDGVKLSLEQYDKNMEYLCDQNIQYLFKVLSDEKVPFEAKQKLARSTLTKHLNLKTASGCRNFVLCMVLILLYLFSTQNMSNYHIIIENLIKAIKEGRISRELGRVIIRKLKKKGCLIDPEFLEVVNS
jgi:hypothetical protein